jgi:hypothetical protein
MIVRIASLGTPAIASADRAVVVASSMLGTSHERSNGQHHPIA